MTINLLKDRGTALDQQRFTWKELVGNPISKLDSEAFSRVRIILMNGVELKDRHCSPDSARLKRPRWASVAPAAMGAPSGSTRSK